VLGPEALFGSCAVMCAVTAVYATVRLHSGTGPTSAVPFSAAASAAAPTSFEMDPRANEPVEDDATGDAVTGLSGSEAPETVVAEEHARPSPDGTLEKLAQAQEMAAKGDDEPSSG